MYIKKLHLKDYKRFHDLTIDLGENPKRIVTLVGPNGCGKSSVLDAIIYRASSYSGQIGRRIAIDNKYHYLTSEGSHDYRSLVQIEFTSGDYDSVAQIRHQNNTSQTIISFRSSYRYNSQLKINETKSVSDIAINNYGAAYASDLDQRMEENYRRLLAKYNNYIEKHDVRPSDGKKHIIGELNQALSKCLDLSIKSLGNVADNRGTMYFEKNDSDVEIEYAFLSAGEKEVVDILLDLYLRKEAYCDTIYIIDEPELHLNTSVQRNLMIEINKMIPLNCQIWIATHSAGFLRALQEDLKEESQIIEFDGSNQWASNAYILKPIVPSRNVWKKLFSTALDDLSELICPRVIIYCEGRDKPGANGKERGLDADCYNTIFAKKYSDVFFVSSGGNTELDQRSDIAIAILGKVFPNLEIWVLKDRDVGSGKAMNEDDRQLYLQNNSHNHRILNRYEIENYLYDESVLRVYCERNGLEFNEDKYNDMVHDVINDNLKDVTGIIKSVCGIKTSINAEIFKRQLASYITEDMSVYKELEEIVFDRR